MQVVRRAQRGLDRRLVVPPAEVDRAADRVDRRPPRAVSRASGQISRSVVKVARRGRSSLRVRVGVLAIGFGVRRVEAGFAALGNWLIAWLVERFYEILDAFFGLRV